MRLYAFLLVAAVALHARAATIPEGASEKKIDANFPEDIHKTPGNISSEPELLEQVNTIKDVENKLRVKPENIPVEVVVENVQPSLKADDELEEVNRPVPDLRNPGPPQRQEHETQNPEYYASEQQPVLNFKQSINEAQNVLRQGLQKITDGIQNVIGSKEQVETIQQNILSVREGFTDQINKINGTIQKYFKENSNNNVPAVTQTKLRFHQIEKGLETIKEDFNRGVKNLTDGIKTVASLKDDSTNTSENPSSNSTTTGSESTSTDTTAWDKLQAQVGYMWNNMTQLVQGLIQGNQNSSPTGAPAEGQPGSSWPNFQWPTNFPNIQNLFQSPSSSTESPTTQSTNENKPDGHEAEKPTETTTLGPIRQILQNIPIGQGILNAVQKLQQNIVNPEKSREVNKVEEQKAAEDTKQDKEKSETESTKGGFYRPPPNNGGYNTGDNIDINGSRIEENLTLNEEKKNSDIQKPKEEEIEPHKTQEVVDKTE